jgi:alpha-tubulin suppressor-like RCC1 family protein
VSSSSYKRAKNTNVNLITYQGNIMKKYVLAIVSSYMAAHALPSLAAAPQVVSAYVSAALKSNGSVWAWGNSCSSDIAKQLKDNAGSNISGVKGIATVGYYGVLLINPDGSLTRSQGCGGSWDTVKDSSGNPVTNAVQASGAGSTAFVKTDGTVWNFGSNAYGQLGTGSAGGISNGAVQVKTGAAAFLTGVKTVRVNELFSVALKTDGTLWTWGYSWRTPGNYYAAQLKDSAGNPITNVSSIGAGGHDVFHFVKTDGSLFAVSVRNGKVSPIKNASGAALTNMLGVDGTNMYGADAGVAVATGGNVWQWGQSPNAFSAGDSAFQVKATGNTLLTDVQTVAGNIYNTLALKNDSTVWQWGTGDQGMSTPVGGFVASQVMDTNGKPLTLVVGTSCP